MKESMKIKFDLKPCNDGAEFLASRTPREAWDNCARGDWMWWALIHSGNIPEKKISVAFANWCAKRAKKYFSANNAATAYYAATAASDAATAASDAAWAAAVADAYYGEKKAQADWIRKHVEYPLSRN